MRLLELAHAGRNIQLPLSIELDSTSSLVIEQLLRVLPNRRYVAKADWLGKTVLAKLFVGDKAKKHYARELQGVSLLAQQHISTPKLLAHHVNDEGGYLFFEYLENSQTLDYQWRHLASESMLRSTAQQNILQQALASIAILHLQGLWQEDLHLDNLLAKENCLYWIDGDGVSVEKPGNPLSKDKVTNNLAVFFAQLPPEIDTLLPEYIRYYQQYNTTVTLSVDELYKAIVSIRKWRVKNILKKIRRDCTLFSVRNTLNGFYGVVRQQEATLAPLLANPDQFIDKGRFIKGFGTTNVVDTVVNGLHIVLKRYNIKSFKHRLSRFWRPTRGWHSWQEGFRLMMLGIPTAKPLALIEERFQGMRGRAWLITEFLEGPDLLTHLKRYEQSEVPSVELEAIGILFDCLIAQRITHGDLKGTNLFWVNQQWVLIDLDAVKQHHNNRSYQRAYAKDRARFLRNWPKGSALYTQFGQYLPTVDQVIDHYYRLNGVKN
ncbi:serine/threonine protein kinase [Entomomonas moraniae]|uniref:Serine/threonine protein kinase n=1 Tax=Entomomonas moraniae TaxID=2213226 RepID=A0A3S9XFV9_9GAMM|nr:lipopolysaccharide kinase InaA family protein [Entomomonas moraniae]AZS51324.1 serine/threonine protein kinase [Entomomonas moraniae]